jgi:hypothetical protein
MAVSDARKRANAKWNKANYEQILIYVQKGEKDKIRAHTETYDESLNAFINRAIYETIERDVQIEKRAGMKKRLLEIKEEE